MTPPIYHIAATFCLIALSACVETAETDPQIDAAAGQMLFAETCSVCHGDPAAGRPANVLVGGKLPPNLALLSKKNGGVFPQDYVMSAIDGFGRTDHHANPMPEFGAGDALGPIVMVERDGLLTPVPAELLALSAYIESFQE